MNQVKQKLVWGLFALIVILGCGGAGRPFVPDITQITTSGNFSVLGSGTQTITQGQTATFNLQVLLGQEQYLLDRSPAPVQLSVSGLPNDSTASFSSNPVTPTDPATDVTMTVVTQPTTTPGTYGLTVTGNDGDLTETTTFTLVVNAIVPFTMQIETVDGQFESQDLIQTRPKPGVVGDDCAIYRLTITAPPGYVGQARVEYRFTQTGAPTGQDVHAQWHFGQANLVQETFTYDIGAANETDSMECALLRSRQPVPEGTFEIEFKVTPLVNGFAPITGTASVLIFNPNQAGRKLP